MLVMFSIVFRFRIFVRAKYIYRDSISTVYIRKRKLTSCTIVEKSPFDMFFFSAINSAEYFSVSRLEETFTS